MNILNKFHLYKTRLVALLNNKLTAIKIQLIAKNNFYHLIDLVNPDVCVFYFEKDLLLRNKKLFLCRNYHSNLLVAYNY